MMTDAYTKAVLTVIGTMLRACCADGAVVTQRRNAVLSPKAGDRSSYRSIRYWSQRG